MFCANGSISRLTGGILTAILIAVTVFSVSPYRVPVAGANGFTVPIARGESGPYSYIVGIWPPDPAVGNLHMAITLAGERGAVTDAEVTVTGRMPGGATVAGPVPATSFLEPWTYELNLGLTEPGEWTFEIAISSSLGDTVFDAPLEIAGGQEPTRQAAEEPSATVSVDQGQETARQAPITVALGAQGSLENPGEVRPPPGQFLEDGGFSWVFLALPIAILALASVAWLYWRKRSPVLSRAGRRRQTARRDQRRRP